MLPLNDLLLLLEIKKKMLIMFYVVKWLISNKFAKSTLQTVVTCNVKIYSVLHLYGPLIYKVAKSIKDLCFNILKH